MLVGPKHSNPGQQSQLKYGHEPLRRYKPSPNELKTLGWGRSPWMPNSREAFFWVLQPVAFKPISLSTEQKLKRVHKKIWFYIGLGHRLDPFLFVYYFSKFPHKRKYRRFISKNHKIKPVPIRLVRDGDIVITIIIYEKGLKQMITMMRPKELGQIFLNFNH